VGGKEGLLDFCVWHLMTWSVLGRDFGQKQSVHGTVQWDLCIFRLCLYETERVNCWCGSSARRKQIDVDLLH